APDALVKLVNRRLLRIEERLDVRRVELTHDVLTGIVKASRDQRHEREAREATERALAEQREREYAARRALRRARAVAAGCALLALLAIAATVAAFFSMQRARRAEQVARQTRTISEQARQEAEGLLGFLTDNFVDELTTFGRYQTIAELSQREIDYFQHLPPQLEDPETIRSGALALINHAEAEAEIGDPVTAEKNASEAIGLLERLRRTDESDATALVLGRAYAELGLLLAYQQESAKADIAFQRALDLLRPQAERTRAPLEARRAYLHALVGLVVEEVNSVQEAKALGVARQALRVAEGLGAPKDADVTVDADYAFAQAWLTEALAYLGRYDEASRRGEEDLGLADQILAQHPQYGEALLTKEVVGQGLSLGALRDESDPVEALQFATQGAQASLALVNIEPGNALYANQLGNSYAISMLAMWQAGRLRASIAYGQRAMQTYGRRVAGFSYGLTNLSAAMSTLASEQAQLGDFTGAAATLAVAKAFFSPSALRKLGPAAGTAEARFSASQDGALAAIAYERGDFAAARHIAHTPIAALKVQSVDQLSTVSALARGEGRADYALGDFAAAEQAERTSLGGMHALAKFVGGSNLQRDEAQTAIWLSMVLAREGKREEAARTIPPAVQTYRALAKRNHGDQWLPLEFAEALYAQSLTDNQHRAALLREASHLVDHLIPSIAKLHDTR
ncbi:MAG: hypothetical protein WBE92_13725, partial [Steroidobacteraceae bacterium]